LTFNERRLDIKSVKLITFKPSGHNETHYTLVLACADGTKLPQLLIFNTKMMPSDNIPQGICVNINAKDEGTKME
jgi:hypothetical protein